jgi:hypothetical protein
LNVLAGLMGLVDASIIWWLDHSDKSQEDLVDRLTGHVLVVLQQMLTALGLEVPADLVIEPQD